MGSFENTPGVKTISDFVVEMMMDPEQGEEFTREYLKAKFLSEAIRTLHEARRNAGLTQTQVAELLETKQASIARLEADKNGSMSLHRYVEFVLACGMVPLDIPLAPLEFVRDYIIAHPQERQTASLYHAWQQKASQVMPQYSTTIQVKEAAVPQTSTLAQPTTCHTHSQEKVAA